MSFKSFACVAALAAITAASANAQGPTISAVDNGDGTATIQITPDNSFLDVPGAALAVELAVTLSGGATLETGTVDFEGVTGDVTISDPLVFDTPNPGDSPFIDGSPISGDATGITAPSTTEIFVSFGSAVVGAGGSVGTIDVFDIDFSGSGMLTVASDSLPFAGGDVAAQGGGFDDIVNIAPVMIAISDGPSGIPGDFNGNGFIDSSDIGIFVNSFQNSPFGPTPPVEPGDFNDNNEIDSSDIGIFVNSFQNFPAPATAIPEPSSLLLLSLVAACPLLRRGK